MSPLKLGLPSGRVILNPSCQSSPELLLPCKPPVNVVGPLVFGRINCAKIASPVGPSSGSIQKTAPSLAFKGALFHCSKSIPIVVKGFRGFSSCRPTDSHESYCNSGLVVRRLETRSRLIPP